jgi:hypothetical protein
MSTILIDLHAAFRLAEADNNDLSEESEDPALLSYKITMDSIWKMQS